jgi:hypothetical protein
MAAGLGFKTFTTGEVLTAADVNGYLMQGVLVFADAAARDAAITSPQEGQFAFTKDNNSLWYYDSVAWVASGATGDIEGVTAGTGLTGGGTSGTVTLNFDVANFGGGSYAAGKNRIINGAMIIDQRNAGAAVTVNANSAFYPVDRFQGVGLASDGVFTLQQSTSTPPAGLINYIRATVTTADASIGASERYFLQQKIEANQLYNFGLGTADAKTFTLSFYVRSSLTGTFSGAMRNSAASRSYVFSYTINAANTWERKSITLTGDTTGTWETGVNTGMNLNWSLGTGSTLSTTANAWTAGNFVAETGAVNLIGTLSATWDITGVQLELGSVATEFSLATGTIAGELAACQRYFNRAVNGSVNSNYRLSGGNAISSSGAELNYSFPVTMRTSPTVSVSAAGDYFLISSSGGVAGYPTSISGGILTPTNARVDATGAAGLTAGNATALQAANSSARLDFSAEL